MTRTREQVLKDRARIAEMACFGGKTQEEIGEALGLSQGTVSKELTIVRAEWRKAAQANIEEIVAQECRKLDVMEDEARQAYEKSKADRVVKTVTKGALTSSSSLTTEGQYGDPRYLRIILDCQDRRSKLLGLDKPTRLEHSSPDGSMSPGTVDPAIVAAVVDKLLS